jgi:hypothetical protein
MSGFDLVAIFARPPNPDAVLRQKGGATKEISREEPSDDQQREAITESTEEEPYEAEWPVFVQKALKGLSERVRAKKPAFLSSETLQIGSGSVVKIDEAKLSYDGGLWMLNHGAVQLSARSWWLPNLSDEYIELDSMSWIGVQFMTKTVYSINKRTPTSRERLLVLALDQTKRPSVIVDVHPTQNTDASAVYISNLLDLEISANDLFSGNKIYLE